MAALDREPERSILSVVEHEEVKTILDNELSVVESSTRMRSRGVNLSDFVETSSISDQAKQLHKVQMYRHNLSIS